MRRARFSPSSLPHLAKCPGWAGGPPSEAAQRGTDLDACITSLIAGDFVDVPDEFIEQVAFAIKAYGEAVAVFDKNSKPQILPQHFIKTLIPEVYGTADLVIIGMRNGKLHVVIIDWKSGYSERGAAANHLQLRTYGAGVLTSNPEIETVELWLVELDKGYISKSDVFARKEFLDTTHQQIINIIEKTKSAAEEDYRENTSCRYCIRAVTCPALDASLRALTVQQDQATIDNPSKVADMMAPDKVGWFLDKWKSKVETANSLLKSVEQRAFAIIKAGGEVPGWIVGEGRKMRSWEDEDVAGATLQAKFGDAVYALALKSPAQVEKEFKGSKDLIKSLVKTKASEKLVPSEGA